MQQQDQSPDPLGPSRELSRQATPLGASMTLIAAVVLFTLGGKWLDDRWGTSPLCLLIGFGLGALGGFIHLVNAVSPELLPFGPKPEKSQSQESQKSTSRESGRDPD